MKAEFQRIGRRDKKALLSERCQGIEEKNRTGNTRDLLKKIGNAKGIFHAKMVLIKDRNGKDLKEAEEIKKRWQEYTEELYKICLNDLDNHNGVFTHPGLDILECKVKWALGSIAMNKASGGDGITAELFKILKDDSVKCCTQYISKFRKLSSGHRTGEVQFSFQSQRRGMPTNVLFVPISHASKVMLKILQASLQAVCEPRISRCTSLVFKRQRN